MIGTDREREREREREGEPGKSVLIERLDDDDDDDDGERINSFHPRNAKFFFSGIRLRKMKTNEN